MIEYKWDNASVKYFLDRYTEPPNKDFFQTKCGSLRLINRLRTTLWKRRGDPMLTIYLSISLKRLQDYQECS